MSTTLCVVMMMMMQGGWRWLTGMIQPGRMPAPLDGVSIAILARSMTIVTCVGTISKSRVGLLISRGVVEHGVHLILQHRDIGGLRDVQRTGALGSQGLASKLKTFIWGTGRHVDRGGGRNSSTKPHRRGDRRKEKEEASHEDVMEIFKPAQAKVGLFYLWEKEPGRWKRFVREIREKPMGKRRWRR